MVEIRGNGFIPGTMVQFGSAGAVEANVLGPTSLIAATPAMEAGVYAVTVSNQNGSDTLDSAFVFYDPVRVEGVDPFAGPEHRKYALRFRPMSG